jgi:hypothetical protein
MYAKKQEIRHADLIYLSPTANHKTLMHSYELIHPEPAH